MAVYGIGAMYGGTDDQTNNFIKLGVACVGWSPDEAPAIHAQMASVKIGDVFFIKSYAPNTGLHIKAVGVVTDATFRKVTDALGWGVSVCWIPVLQEQTAIGPLGDHSDYMRRGALYEEFNPSISQHIMDLLVPKPMERVMKALTKTTRRDSGPNQEAEKSNGFRRRI